MRWTRSDRAIGSAVLAFCALFPVAGCDEHAQTPETPVQREVLVSYSPTPSLAIGLHTVPASHRGAQRRGAPALRERGKQMSGDWLLACSFLAVCILLPIGIVACIWAAIQEHRTNKRFEREHREIDRRIRGGA